MPNNICASPSLDKETRIYQDRDGWKWQRETEGKQSATCLQMAAGHARYVKEQESSFCIHTKQKQTKPSKSVNFAGINNHWSFNGVRHHTWTFVFLWCLTPFSSRGSA
jgi:hypothetical protein